MNPGPSNSSNANTVPLTATVDQNGNVLAIYGNGGTIINDQTFSANIGASFIYELTTYPSGVAPTGSIGNNGALTLGTALDLVYGPTGVSPGIWLYFPAGAVYSGSVAGSYWCVMTSTTVGTIFNNILGSPSEPLPPLTLFPVIATGPGAYTGVTTEVPVMAINITGNTMGATGNLACDSFWSFNNTANAKTGRVRWGGASGTVIDTVSGANNATALSKSDIYNRTTGFQVVGPALAYGLSTSAPITATQDTTQNVLLVATVQLATATDWFIIQTLNILARFENELVPDLPTA